MTKENLEYEISILRDIRSREGWNQKEADRHHFLMKELKKRFTDSKYIDTLVCDKHDYNSYSGGTCKKCGALDSSEAN